MTVRPQGDGCRVGRPRLDGRVRVVLDVAAHLASPLGRVEPRHEVEGHVDPGRDAGGRHDLAAVDEPVLGPDVDRRVELAEVVQWLQYVVAGRPSQEPAAA